MISNLQDYSMQCNLCGHGEATASILPDDPREKLNHFSEKIICTLCLLFCVRGSKQNYIYRNFRGYYTDLVSSLGSKNSFLRKYLEAPPQIWACWLQVTHIISLHPGWRLVVQYCLEVQVFNIFMGNNDLWTVKLILNSSLQLIARLIHTLIQIDCPN